MLGIVAQNLTENAIRYAGHGATFTLSIAREPDATVLRAADDGIGVSDADLPRLFERFWRADAARATRGTGLGPRDRQADRARGRRHASRRPAPAATGYRCAASSPTHPRGACDAE